MKEIVRSSWEEVNFFIKALSRNNKTWTGVYGIPRGGLCIAVMISHKLNIPLLLAPTKGCLVVDDICDSGRTLVHYHEKYDTATLYYKDEACMKPNYTLKKATSEQWIVFPWEE